MAYVRGRGGGGWGQCPPPPTILNTLIFEHPSTRIYNFISYPVCFDDEITIDLYKLVSFFSLADIFILKSRSSSKRHQFLGRILRAPIRLKETVI